MNTVILIGRLGQDPEVRYTPSGKAVASFSLATKEYNNETEWHRIEAWEKTAELCGEYLQKGREVAITGRLKTDSWEDQEGNKRYKTKVVAYQVEFLGKKGSDQNKKTDAPPMPGDDDEIPF